MRHSILLVVYKNEPLLTKERSNALRGKAFKRESYRKWVLNLNRKIE